MTTPTVLFQKIKTTALASLLAFAASAHAQDGTIHRYVQFDIGDQLWMLIGSTRDSAQVRFREEMDFIVSRILEPPPEETKSDSRDYLKAMEALNRQQQTYQMMSNMLQMQHETSMAIIHNMGSGWHYEYR